MHFEKKKMLSCKVIKETKGPEAVLPELVRIVANIYAVMCVAGVMVSKMDENCLANGLSNSDGEYPVIFNSLS